MKYEEKQRRKKLKRKIWVAAAGLVVLGAVTTWTWDYAWELNGGWRPSPNSNDFKHFEIAFAHGGIIVNFNIDANIKLSEQQAERTRQTQEEIIKWGIITGKWQAGYPKLEEIPKARHFRHVGFEFQYSSAHGKKPWAEFDETTITCIFPIWLFAVTPALLIAWWSFKLKRAGSKESAFPVIAKENPKQP